jgi:RNA polymerase sigma-70 factor (ECF subfamily)
MHSDAHLIQASIQGDDNAFKTLVKKYESRIAATVIGMLGPGREAEDVAQETFIRFYTSLKQFKGKSSVITYLTRIAINLSFNELKRRKRRRMRFRHSVSDTDIDLPDPDTREYDDEGEIVHRAIQQLTPEFRSVIVLRFMEAYSIKEIAEILKIPQGTVLSRLARAQKKLKPLLAPILGENHVKQSGRSFAQIA